MPNELVCDLFDYLDGWDIHHAFSRLNIRFESFVNRSLLPLRINLSSKSQSTIEENCRNVIIPNRHRLFSLHLYTHPVIRTFFDYCIIDDSFIRLQSIILRGLPANKLLAILFHLNFLPRLSSLTIYLEDDYYYNLSDIYRLLFRLPALKYSKVSVTDCEESDLHLPMPINGKASTIEHLVINFPCTVGELTSLLHHTPHLQRLTCCDRLIETDNSEKNRDEPLTLLQLKSICIDECEITFDEFEPFIKRISSQLRTLRFKTSSSDYFDAQRWKQLIKKHMPHLQKFHFSCGLYTGSPTGMIVAFNGETINQFTSTFWTDRHCFFEMATTDDELVYSINSKKSVLNETFHSKFCFFHSRKMWFDHPLSNEIVHFNAMKSVDLQSKTTTTRPIQLTINEYPADAWKPELIDAMKPCFDAVEFTHLNINCIGLPFKILIEIIHLLPNLLSLELSFLTRLQSQSLSFEDSEMLLLVSITNKITKVKVDHIQSIEQMHLLMDLCPRMRYLEVGYTTDNDLEKIIGSISMSSNTRALYLCSLCLCKTGSQEQLIDTLNNMIDFERLFQPESKAFRNYVIHRGQNKVFLHWNLS